MEEFLKKYYRNCEVLTNVKTRNDYNVYVIKIFGVENVYRFIVSKNYSVQTFIMPTIFNNIIKEQETIQNMLHTLNVFDQNGGYTLIMHSTMIVFDVKYSDMESLTAEYSAYRLNMNT